MIPKEVFFTSGVGTHKDKLHSFELALRDASIEQFNLVKVSSILPPNCDIVSKEEGLKKLSPGQIVFVVLSRNSTDEPSRPLSASVGVAVPTEGKNYGYISEHNAFGEKKEAAGEYAEDLAASMLASTLGVEFDPEKAWDERKEVLKMSGKIVKTRNTTQIAKGDKDGNWTSVVSAAVFICDV